MLRLLGILSLGNLLFGGHHHRRALRRGLLLGALVGLIYMLLGVVLYALLSGQSLPFTAYLSDIAMGIAGGGIAGAIIGGMKK